MADRDISIPLGPDRTNGMGHNAVIEGIPAEGELKAFGDAAPVQADVRVAPETAASPDAQAPVSGLSAGADSDTMLNEQGAAAIDALNLSAKPSAAPPEDTGVAEAIPQSAPEPDEYLIGGLSEEEAAVQGMDEMQMSILALRDSIDQGRELKAREKEREELAEALEADHEELADRDDILANYTTLVAEQDAIITGSTQEREALKAELAQATAQIEETEQALARMRAYHDEQLQPIEGELGRVRALADRAKNDERSRKSELNAAESELRRAGEGDSNTMALARQRQAQENYELACRASEQAKDQLAQIERTYEDAKQQVEQAEAPLERSIEDLTKRSEELKARINELGEDISVATKRRQYCDTVYQYPDETAKMRAEVEQAEQTARQMDVENDALREQLAHSKKKAVKAKIAIGIVIAIVVVLIIAFVAAMNR